MKPELTDDELDLLILTLDTYLEQGKQIAPLARTWHAEMKQIAVITDKLKEERGIRQGTRGEANA